MGGETRDDGELLREFLSTRREAAFEALVRRHHAMVLGVCVRTLGDAHSAEDVAQAVFLILAHRAGSLKDQVSISAWLYHVAWKQSQNIRRSAALRRKREREAGERMESSASREQAWEQISPALDREISALPEKYRAPIILHYLEGLTEEQVAARLESNRGTMSTRLARACDLLKSRMVQRGVTVSGAALFALIGERAATAAVSPTVVASTAQAATLIVSGKALSAGLVSSQAAAIVEGGLKAFLWMKIKIAAAIAAMIAVGGVTAYQSFEPLKAQSWVSRLDTLQPGEWYEAPNTRLNSAGPGVFPPDPLPPGNPSRVIGAWGGGTYDTKRDRLIIHGGGLNDYGGNEIYTFDVHTLAWSRPWGPSRDIPTQPTEIPGLYPQGNPASVATYDGLVYLPIQDKLWRGGGTAYLGNGGGNALAWTFDFNTSTWQRKAESHLLGVGVFSDVDPVTGHIFAAADRSILGDYDPLTDKWTVHREIIERGEEMTGVVDPVNRLFIGIGNGFLSHYNIATGKVTNRQPSTGGEAIVRSRGPGLAYDPVLKKVVAWHGGRSVYSLDVATWRWTEHKPARTNAVTPPMPSRVVFGRFSYIPSRNLYILVTAVDHNVFFYKLTDGAKR